MIGDIILIKKPDLARGKGLISVLCKLPDKSIITIGGGSGTSKSELGHVLQELLYKTNKKTILISLDDIYYTHFKDRLRIRKRKGIKAVGTQEIDWVTLKKIIKEFKKKKDMLSLPVINKYTNSYNEEQVYGADEINYILIEGLYANYLNKWKLSNYAIHLEGNPEQTLKFRKKRKKENESSEFRKKVVQKEFKVVSQLRQYADIIIPFNEEKR